HAGAGYVLDPDPRINPQLTPVRLESTRVTSTGQNSRGQPLLMPRWPNHWNLSVVHPPFIGVRSNWIAIGSGSDLQRNRKKIFAEENYKPCRSTDISLNSQVRTRVVDCLTISQAISQLAGDTPAAMP
ncbi:hypothetical protein T310_8844, partial [Rasamsonia emersonii CBS 393.64]